MKILRNILSLNHRLRTKGSYKKTTITVHSTGNADSTAENERNWLDNISNTRDASWHYVVGENVIIQALPDDAEAWHCGDSNGNKYSLSVEICESGDRKKTLRNAAEFVAQKADELGLSENEIVRHFDWTGKNCPRILIDDKYIKAGMDWKWFIMEVKGFMANITQHEFNEMLDNYLEERAKKEPSEWSENARKWAESNNIVVGDENGSKKYKSFVTKEELVAVLCKLKGVK